MGTTAKHIPRKLVEQNHKRECSFWAFFPCREFTSRRRLMDRKKLRPDSQVEVFVLPEPSLRPRFAPKRYDLS
jgi:hypothetical protein